MRPPIALPLSIAGLKAALALRLIGLGVFPLAALVLAALQRSPMALAVLAFAMLMASFIERRRMARLMGETALLRPSRLAMGFAFRLGLLIGIFVLTLGVLALFRDTALARELGLIDLAVILPPLLIALGANAVSAFVAGRSTAEARRLMGAAMAASRQPPPPEGEIIEGEILDRDPEDPSGGPRA